MRIPFYTVGVVVLVLLAITSYSPIARLLFIVLALWLAVSGLARGARAQALQASRDALDILREQGRWISTYDLTRLIADKRYAAVCAQARKPVRRAEVYPTLLCDRLALRKELELYYRTGVLDRTVCALSEEEIQGGDEAPGFMWRFKGVSAKRGPWGARPATGAA